MRQLLVLRGDRVQTPASAVTAVFMAVEANPEDHRPTETLTVGSTMLSNDGDKEVVADDFMLLPPFQSPVNDSMSQVGSALVQTPGGFSKLSSSRLLSAGTTGLIEAIHEAVRQQQRPKPAASSIHADDSTWLDLHIRIREVDLAEGNKMPGRLIRFGMVAYVFQNFSEDFRQHRGQFISGVTGNVVHMFVESETLDLVKLVGQRLSDEDIEELRNCVIWVLVCVAAANDWWRADEGGRDVNPNVEASSLRLVNMVKTLCRLGELGIDDVESGRW